MTGKTAGETAEVARQSTDTDLAPTDSRSPLDFLIQKYKRISCGSVRLRKHQAPQQQALGCAHLRSAGLLKRAGLRMPAADPTTENPRNKLGGWPHGA